ncbi:MAG: glutamate synthase subunit alpha [Rhizobiales bacterium NRL2]|jgi:glutamate synthase (NADPH/NADH) large chain|nr:MAG: glutamate synthase subunit alpha [Rhizobiales bacterium NRL2]
MTRQTETPRAFGLPPRQGLYDPSREKDSCGIGFVVDIKGRKSHDIVSQGLQILVNLTHRGAVGADPLEGDGAGIIIQIPHAFFGEVCDFELPEPGQYGVLNVFLPKDRDVRILCENIIDRYVVGEGQHILGWRDVPVNREGVGESVLRVEPTIRQLFVGRDPALADQDAFERKLFVIRKQIANEVRKVEHPSAAQFYVTSSSSRTVCYKGMLLAGQVESYYEDLQDARVISSLALVHQRFSTNTFPAWALAHPFRLICHNGEINTVRGNVNWMAARGQALESELLGKDLRKVWPLIAEGQSDSACFDNALELLVAGGYSLCHAMMMLIPEAWDDNPLMDDERRAFYEHHAALMEPWDGPAAVAFTDGRQIGATLDRNGLRPARYIVTTDDRVILASEAGVLPVPEDEIVHKWRLQPGKMLLIDTEEGRIISDDEIKAELSRKHPYQRWVEESQLKIDDLPPASAPMRPNHSTLLDLQQVFGYTQEDLKFLMQPMAETGAEAIGSMGNDVPIAALSSKGRPLYNYFKQLFAQVTNPPIDPIREELVMSLLSFIGPRPNLLGLGEGAHKRLEMSQPILTNEDLEKIRHIEDVPTNAFHAQTLDAVYPAEDGADGMRKRIAELQLEAEECVRRGENIIILSDRHVDMDSIPIPAVLATSAVHHHLVRTGLRTSVGLVVETGEAREVHHFCVLAGYGAEAINPWLAFQTLSDMHPGIAPEDERRLHKNYIKAIGKGILKVMSKMGISTYQSYCGAQIFDAVGLSSAFVAEYFPGTHTQIEGIGLDVIATETVDRHRLAYSDAPIYRTALDVGGDYAFRVRGESHIWTPETIGLLQHAVRGGSQDQYRAYAASVNDQNKQYLTPRGLFELRYQDEPVPLDEVEPAAEIVKRFSTGAMSFGSISREAHATLAVAMNRIGGKSNTGEGGEEPERFVPKPNGDSERSAIKQVASGRFGVTAEYLVNSDMMQIKMAQGAKPGEGGQLPGHKVDRVIARVRHSTPGVGLISPPPHHDIYSIEDLAQLIYDLKNVNPDGDVSVKLVSEVGVGVVAAGVSKAKADHVTIAGYEGGTGASPLTSIKHAGSPWEIGLAETQQALVLNRLRSRIAVQVDGGLRTGRDVIVGALLGADEFGFATAPLIAAGCIMMRKCHLNTCPVGIATQDPELRKKFTGAPEHVINYFFYVAEEVREIMARLGIRKFDDLIGRTDLLDKKKAIDHWKARGLDFERLFYRPKVAKDVAIYNSERQAHDIYEILDRKLIELARPAIADGQPVQAEMPIKNTDRTTGAMLSGEVAKRYGHAGMPEDTISFRFTGTAGQSFGAFLARGVSFELIGDGNDYVGKGLSGGRISIYPNPKSRIEPETSIVVGNTVLYGAIAGECYFRGVAGERFGVRNSGATAVVEGVGDHGCEYMTGGVVMVIGPTGRNFAAGMSGGIAYVLDEAGDFSRRCNPEMVDLSMIDPEDVAPGDDIGDHLQHDVSRIRELLERHAHYTNSRRARALLDDFEDTLTKFVKITPRDYARALTELRAAAEGADETVPALAGDD